MIDLNLSRNLAARGRGGCLLGLLLLAVLPAMRAAQAAELAATNTPGAIPWNQIGAKAGADYKGDGLAVTPTEAGARLHCVFQRLDGEATPEGLWLTSTVTNTVSDRFRVTAMAVGRAPEKQKAESRKQKFEMGERRAESGKGGSEVQLADTGKVSVDGQTVRFSRPGLTEEYSVSMDGVRQDFIVEQAPASPPAGELVVKLAVSGARVETVADGARLVLAYSGRKIAYSRLRVTDATGKELPARIEVSTAGDEATSLSSWVMADKDIEELSLLTPAPAREELAVVVNDAEAVYPVRIDPTFSDANWVSMGGLPGANGSVLAVVVDGLGNFYIGGEFTSVGNITANNIAQWDGSSWSPLGSGMSGMGRVGYGTSVLVLAVSGGTLYAGGYFTTAGGNAANYIAQWNGSSWSPLDSGMSGGNEYGPYVDALAVSGSTLYAGGDFTSAGGSAANCIAQWNGSRWSPLGSGVSGSGQDGDGPIVLALAVSGSTLYAGGDFTAAGGGQANFIAQWNGSSWSPLGYGLGSSYGRPAYGYVTALAVSGSTLYAGGNFSSAGGSPADYIAQWNGTSWSPLGSGMNHLVAALAVSGSTLYAGGQFTTAGGNAANYIAQWDGSSWSALGSGVKRGVAALAVSGSTLYAGGGFTTAGGNPANCIAQWDGSGWSALGSGMTGLNSTAYALAVSGSTLYAGGGFTTAGGNPANCIAQWDGSGWSALGSGMSGGNEYGPYVGALAVSGGMLYAGGNFTTAGGSPANYIAQWNGTNWSALGSGMNFYVDALAVSGSTLYAGGYLMSAGGNAANYIAQWNGSSWSALGSGMSGVGGDGGGPYVSVLAVSGNTLYAGGEFTTAGGSAANSIAQWDGSSWSAVGSGMNGTVLALAVSGSTLYAGGYFTTVGGSAANNIAQWNGSSWSALGSGMNYSVSALAVSGGTLYAGGDFTTAGTNVSAYAAMANLPGAPVSVAIITTNAAFGFTNGVFGFDVSGPSGSNVVIQASTDLQTWIPLQTNLLGSGLLHFSDAQSPANVKRFYRARLSP
jgi:hypothetical protein